MSWFSDKNLSFFWKCQIQMVHAILRYFTDFIARIKTWTVILLIAKKRQKPQLQLCKGNFTANNKCYQCLHPTCLLIFTPSQLSEYLHAHIIYLKCTPWSCFSLIPSQTPSNASLLLRQYSSQYITVSSQPELLHLLWFTLLICITIPFLQLSCNIVPSPNN